MKRDKYLPEEITWFRLPEYVENLYKIVREMSTGTGGSALITEDITATLQVGGINENQVVTEGTDITTFVKDLLTPIIMPTVNQPISLQVSGVNASTVEVGELYTTQITHVFNRGAIDNKDRVPNTFLVGPETTTDYIGIGISSSGAISKNINLGYNNWKVKVNYSQGVDPYYDSSGNIATNLDSQRVSGSIQETTDSIVGSYRYWYDTGTVGNTPTTSAQVRLLTNKGFTNTSNFNITIPPGDKEVSFYIPSSKSLTKVVFVESSNADVTSTFTLTNMTVNDAGGNNTQYKKYTAVIGGVGYLSAATYKVTIS